MRDHSSTITLVTSVVLIMVGLGAIAGADHYNMRDLANAGTVVVGAGVGLLLPSRSPKNKDTPE